MDGKRPPLTVGRIWRSAVQRLAVVQRDSARRQVGHHRLAVVDQFAHVQQNVAALGLIVQHWAQVRAGDELHGAVVQVHVVQGQPAANQVGGQTFPVSIVLVPEDRPPMMRRLIYRLVVKELDIGADDVFDDVEDTLMVGEPVELNVVFRNLA